MIIHSHQLNLEHIIHSSSEATIVRPSRRSIGHIDSGLLTHASGVLQAGQVLSVGAAQGLRFLCGLLHVGETVDFECQALLLEVFDKQVSDTLHCVLLREAVNWVSVLALDSDSAVNFRVKIDRVLTVCVLAEVLGQVLRAIDLHQEVDSLVD